MPETVFYLSAGPEGFLANYHQPLHGEKQSGVLLIAPYGWEEISSHRPLRLWAERLAVHGHAVLRFDLPSSGDSAADPEDDGRWAAWSAACSTAARWLRSNSESQVVTVVGIGLGGLLAHSALAGGAADQLVMWATPAGGRKFVRELRAFSAMETAQMIGLGAPEPPPLPVGSLAPAGFLLAADTVRDLEQVDPARSPLPPNTRVLLLGRDGIAPDPALATALESSGADLTTMNGRGLNRMLASDPGRARPPWDVLEEIRVWIEELQHHSGHRQSALRVASPGASQRLQLDGFFERPLTVSSGPARLAGILSEPVQRHPLTAVFLNAGAVRRIGPHRLWVETARRWASLGIGSLRIDLEGIGDSDGDGDVFEDVARFHDARFPDQVACILDELEDQGHTAPFLLVGLCSGAYWAFQTAIQDTRVAAALLINPRMLYWNANVEFARDLRRTRLLVHGRRWIWRRLLQGDFSLGRWLALSGWLAGTPVRWLRRLKPTHLSEQEGVEELIANAFDLLNRRGQQLSFVFCDGEPLFEELLPSGFFAESGRWPSVRTTRIPGLDHTLRPLWMHPHVRAAIDEALQRHLDAGDSPRVRATVAVTPETRD